MNTKVSFTQYEKTCKFHNATEERKCFCSIKIEGRTCNKMNCPKFNNPEVK